MRRCAAAFLLLAAAAGMAAAADDGARITAVQAVRRGELVTARVATRGLPDARLLQSMQSGMVSAVELDLALLDPAQEIVAGSRVLLHLSFDLWEEVYAVRDGGAERRFRTLDELRAHLAALEGLPVAPAARLQPDRRYRLRVALQTHPIAPAQKERVEGVIAGERRPLDDDPDHQEAQVSLGRLIRLFYEGGERGAADAEALSPWFTAGDLAREGAP